MEPSEKALQEIVVEEEIQPDGYNQETPPSDDLAKSKSVDDDIRWGKFAIGAKTLRWSIIFMVLCIGLSLWKPDNELINNGFEAFKLIAMTLLGYIFGSNKSE